MILEAAKQTNVPIYVIITMRSDYIGDCSKFEGLPEEINDGEYLIPRLTREEYKSVIEGPIKGGGKLAPRLLQRLLNDIGTRGTNSLSSTCLDANMGRMGLIEKAPRA